MLKGFKMLYASMKTDIVHRPVLAEHPQRGGGGSWAGAVRRLPGPGAFAPGPRPSAANAGGLAAAVPQACTFRLV